MWFSKKHGKKIQKTITAPTGCCHRCKLYHNHFCKSSLQKSFQQNYTLLLLATKLLFEAVTETGVVFQKDFLTGNFFVSMGFQMAIDYVYMIHNVTIIYFKD